MVPHGGKTAFLCRKKCREKCRAVVGHWAPAGSCDLRHAHRRLTAYDSVSTSLNRPRELRAYPVGNEDCFRLLVNFLKYVNRRFAGFIVTSLDLKELHECKVPLAAIEPERIIEFRNLARGLP